MTDEIWSYVLGSGAFPAESRVPESTFKQLKQSFNYFYPMDVRSSGKDLIPNHLTFCVYVHAALFPEHHWPKAMRANGHLMLNGKKMAKSTGNSLTLKDAVQKFGADATRLTLADAGDGMEDANFEELTANSAIQRIYTQLLWCEEALAKKDTFRTGPADTFWDKAFAEELNDFSVKVKDAYEKTWYKEALKYGFYELDNSRRAYLEATADIGMHRDLVLDCIRRTALLVGPIMPHFAEHIWSGMLQQPKSIQATLLPETRPTDLAALAGLHYVRTVTKDVRDRQIALSKKAKGGKNKGPAPADPTKPLKARLFVATTFPKWQTDIVDVIKANIDGEGNFDDAAIRETMIAKGYVKNKKAMPYVVELKRRTAALGAEKALGLALPFPEWETLSTVQAYLEKSLKLEAVELLKVEDAIAQLESGAAKDGEAGFVKTVIEDSEPGAPGVVFYNP
jgi:leucyl-tRNA synthetase